jgi:vacuolar-type H+-ATPase subunit I/STV1
MYNNHQIGELIDKCNLLNKSIYEKNINSLNNNEIEEKNKKLKKELDKTNWSIEDIKRENESKQNLLKHELLIKDKEILRLNEINKMLEIQIQMFNTK